LNNENIQINDTLIHDFTSAKCRWGWSGLSFQLTDRTPVKQKAEMKGIGKGIKANEYIMTSHGRHDVVCLVTKIEYHSNPKDMFDASLSYVGCVEFNPTKFQ
jgi:hypothetical protein